MNDAPEPDWDPTSGVVQSDQLAAYDDMRERHPLAYSDFLGWSLFRHADVVRVLNDHRTFSNAVSRHLSVPNGMDPPGHTGYRRLVEGYFGPDRLAAFEPQCREIATRLARSLPGRDEVEFVGAFAGTFAVQVQCAFLGWPTEVHESLRSWTQNNRAATLSRDRAAMARIAAEFEEFVDGLLRSRRASSAPAADDIVASLLRERLDGQPLRDDVIASILRNWTVGEVGTISTSVGILAHYISEHADLQRQLRAQPSLLLAAIDEILRIHGPLVVNRRITTCPVSIGGRAMQAGERISLNWIAANRDGRVFEDPDAFRLDRDPAANLLYGAGIHVCPGAALARMEMRVAMEALLEHTGGVELIADKPPTNAVYPGSGFATLPLRIR